MRYVCLLMRHAPAESVFVYEFLECVCDAQLIFRKHAHMPGTHTHTRARERQQANDSKRRGIERIGFRLLSQGGATVPYRNCARFCESKSDSMWNCVLPRPPHWHNDFADESTTRWCSIIMDLCLWMAFIPCDASECNGSVVGDVYPVLKILFRHTARNVSSVNSDDGRFAFYLHKRQERERESK